MSPPRRWRARERETVAALVALLLASAAFALWPQIDLAASARFVGADGIFVGKNSTLARVIYQIVPWLGRAVWLFGLVVAIAWWRRPGPLGVRWWRRSRAFALVMLVAVAGLVNGALKEHWGRARPVAVQQFGGTQRFTPAWVLSDQCRHNCSFVSGHAATGFALIGVGMFGTLATRRRWWLAGMAAGLGVGLVRMSQGGHFASDVLLNGLMVWLMCCLLRLAWLRVRVWDRARQAAASP